MPPVQVGATRMRVPVSDELILVHQTECRRLYSPRSRRTFSRVTFNWSSRLGSGKGVSFMGIGPRTFQKFFKGQKEEVHGLLYRNLTR